MPKVYFLQIYMYVIWQCMQDKRHGLVRVRTKTYDPDLLCYPQTWWTYSSTTCSSSSSMWVILYPTSKYNYFINIRAYPVDLTLNQTVNRDASSRHTGIAAFTDSINLCKRWCNVSPVVLMSGSWSRWLVCWIMRNKRHKKQSLTEWSVIIVM